MVFAADQAQNLRVVGFAGLTFEPSEAERSIVGSEALAVSTFPLQIGRAHV